MRTFTFSMLFAALSALACPLLPAAQQVANFAEAESQVTDDGYIIAAYADGWDSYSKARCEQLLADPLLQEAAGGALLLALPIPDVSNDETRAKQAALCGKLRVPAANSYPALIFFDKNGAHYATICGTPVLRGQSDKLAASISKCMAAGKKRTAMLAEAANASGADKAKLLFNAYQIGGLSRAPENLGEQLAQADPEDVSGMRRALNFNPYAFALGLNSKDLNTGLAEVKKILDDPAYSNKQKQQACTAAIGLLRRKGGVKGSAELRRYTALMKKYAPTSTEGRVADYVQRQWMPYLRYAEGWTPAGVPTDDTPIEIEGPLPISKAGTYTVTFEYTHGGEALIITGVTLYDGKKKVAEDIHRGVTGNSHSDNVYTLTVSKPVKEPHLFLSADMSQQNSYGRITIKKD